MASAPLQCLDCWILLCLLALKTNIASTPVWVDLAFASTGMWTAIKQVNSCYQSRERIPHTELIQYFKHSLFDSLRVSFFVSESVGSVSHSYYLELQSMIFLVKLWKKFSDGTMTFLICLVQTAVQKPDIQ